MYYVIVTDFLRGEDISSVLRSHELDIKDTIAMQGSYHQAYAYLCESVCESTKSEEVVLHGHDRLIDIDGARIETEGARTMRARRGENRVYGDYEKKVDGPAYKEVSKGRWPPNTIFVHHSECEHRGQKTVKNESGPVPGSYKDRTSDVHYGTFEKSTEFEAYGDEDGHEIVDDWDCHSTCPVSKLNGQSGMLDQSLSPNWSPSDRLKHNRNESENKTYGIGFRSKRANRGYGDTGGASRFYYQAESWSDVMEYLQYFGSHVIDLTSIEDGRGDK